MFELPAFAPKFSAKSDDPEGGYADPAWSSDGKTLYAAEGAGDSGRIRGWAAPGFSERPAIRAPDAGVGAAIAASPDGRTLAVSGGNPRIVRLYDAEMGSERFRFGAGSSNGNAHRLGYAPDGASLGVLDVNALSWWDAATGKPASPNPACFAMTPAATGASAHPPSLSPDGRKRAQGYTNHRGFGDLGWDSRQKEFGSFIRISDTTTEKEWNWRIGDAQGAGDEPRVAFFPDGAKLAGAVR